MSLEELYLTEEVFSHLAGTHALFLFNHKDQSFLREEITKILCWVESLGEKEAIASAPNVVSEEFAREAPVVTEADLESMLTYPVPEDVGDDACTKVVAKEPFDLGLELFHQQNWREVALTHATTVAIKRLKKVVDRIAEETTVNWVGIYRLVEPKEGFELFSCSFFFFLFSFFSRLFLFAEPRTL